MLDRNQQRVVFGVSAVVGHLDLAISRAGIGGGVHQVQEAPLGGIGCAGGGGSHRDVDRVVDVNRSPNVPAGIPEVVRRHQPVGGELALVAEIPLHHGNG